jgi:23S rRNA pseudouridine1911/1915/1917 synthase
VSREGRARVEALYEDRDVIALDKPEGMPTVPQDGRGAKSLYDVATDLIRRKNPKGRAAVVHRLDRGTSGVVLFAKHARMKKSLMDGWNEAVRERLYVAVVEGRPDADEGVLDDVLREDRDGRVRVCGEGRRGGLRAITRWVLAATNGRFSLVECELETGRRHQIRAQWSAAGHPVAGDARYGARSDPLRRVCLHARTLVIALAPGEEPIRIVSPEPDAFHRLVE